MHKRIKTIDAFQKLARSQGKTYGELQQEETMEHIREKRYKEAGNADTCGDGKGYR